MSTLLDLTGRRFGNLIAIAYESGKWVCLCDCGTFSKKLSGNLRNGMTVSCGGPKCYQESHGMTDTPEYNSWRGMIERCTNPNHDHYNNYGRLGITVCDEWKSSFSKFFAHVGKKPSLAHSIDRFPNEKGNYEPGNVRWATQKQQCRNKRNTKVYTAFGKTMCMSAWAEEVGMSVQTLSWRIHQEKQPIETALRPVRK